MFRDPGEGTLPKCSLWILGRPRSHHVLIGAVLPAAISDWGWHFAPGWLDNLYLVSGRSTRLRNSVGVFDSAGLALFAVAGEQEALAYGLNPVMARCSEC